MKCRCENTDMKPPVKRPGSSGRRNRCESGRKKKPKRLSYISPLVPTEKKALVIPPAFTRHSPSSCVSPPSFNLSFGSEVNDELFSCVDKIDCDLICSTPMTRTRPNLSYATTGSASLSTKLPCNASASPLFDSSSLQGKKDRKLELNSTSGHGLSSFMKTPAKSTEEHLKLSQWGLPELVLKQYAQRGITSIYEWQAECLMKPGVLQGGNLVFSAPTSGGKTFVAELLALKCVLEMRKKVLIILPFVSIAHEKSKYLQGIFESVGVKVGGFMGGQSPSGGFSAIDIAVCTIEKANSLVNRLLEEASITQLGAVVVDELHMIADSHRGFLLELLLTKLLYFAKKSCRSATEPLKCESSQDHEEASSRMIQIIGMSATLPNLDTLAKWLGGQLYCTDFRPIPLKEMVKIGPALFDTNLEKIRDLGELGCVTNDDEEHILMLCRETVSNGHSVLIFCPTKQWCENLAASIASASLLVGVNALPSIEIERKGEDHKDQGDVKTNSAVRLDKAALNNVLVQLQRTQVGLDGVLKKTVPSGVAFHHAGLTFDEREIVEGAFRQGVIKVLVATSTLSSGVNLPARLVIVRTPFFQRSLLDILTYKQMVGRAGRKGEDESGESILICKPNEKPKITGLFQSAPKPIKSCLDHRSRQNSKTNDTIPLRRALLEIIASGIATTSQDIEFYIMCTLLFAELSQRFHKSKSASSKITPIKNPATLAQSLLQSTIEYLLANEFISVRDAADKTGESDKILNATYYATQLGAATVASALSPEEALIVFSELRKARKSFVLENELHILYLVTPVYIQKQWPKIDWYRFLCLLERLPANGRLVANTLGIKESFLASAIQGKIPERTAAQQERLRNHRRFFTALALNDLVHEAPMLQVARKYSASKGLLQTLQNAAGTFAGMVTVFCNRLGWKNLELLLSQFQSRLAFGIERELCDLVKISILNGFRARALYNFGFHSLSALATANPLAIEHCLRNAVPFKSLKAINEREEENDPRTTCTTWCAKLRKGMTEFEATKEIIHEAQKILSEELNIPLETWKIAQAASAQFDVRPLPICHVGVRQTLHPTSDRKRLPGGNPNINVNNDLKKPCLRGLEYIPERACEATNPAMSVQNNTKISVEDCKSPNVQKLLPGNEFFTPLPVLNLNGSITKSVGPIEGSAIDTMDKCIKLTSAASPKSPAEPVSIAHPTLQTICGEEDSISYSPILSPDVIPQFRRSLSHSLLHTPLSLESSRPGSSQHIYLSSGKRSPNLPSETNSPCTSDALNTIPNSFPLSMEMSVSFSSNTLAMIDAACGGEGEKMEELDKDDNMSRSLISGADEKEENDEEKKLEQVRGIDSHSTIANGTAAGITTKLNISPSLKPLVSPGDKGCCNIHQNMFDLNTPCHTVPSDTKAKEHSNTVATAANCPSISAVAPSVSSQLSLKDLSHMSSSQVSLSQSGTCIIEVTTNALLFETFISECLEQKCISFSIATMNTGQSNCIGSKIVQHKAVLGIPTANKSEQVTGVTFLWEGMDIYYVSLCHEDQKEGGNAIPISTRLAAVCKIFQSHHCQQLIAYSIKHHIKTLATVLKLIPLVQCLDPTVADWMLNPDGKEKTLHNMVLHYLPEQPTLFEGEDYEDMSLSSLATHASEPHVRAAAETLLAYLLMSKLKPLLESEKLYSPFLEVEMPSLMILAKMELNGIGFSKEECEDLKQILQSRLLELEVTAYSLAQRSFLLTSPEDVSQVLFLELKLPCPTDSKPQKSLGPNRRGRRRIQHLSTAKDVLEKLKAHHPLPGVILQWRRVSSTVTKTVFPLFKCAMHHEHLNSLRIHPTCQIHTATGRVSTSDPNLQMVPKEFNMGPEAPTSTADALLSESQVLKNACEKDEGDEDGISIHSSTHSAVCMRSVFIPSPGALFLAADYSQLELRILAHLSGDAKLQKVLNSAGDVFKMIASEWLNIPPSSVSPQERQNAKQICYGMVYGIGPKALSEQLGVAEEDAAQFMESFKSKYQMMRKYISSTVESCRENGYIVTLLGRKRYLPGIHSPNIHARSQAERQAVNSTIQGSAADLVKTAMVKIDRVLGAEYKNTQSCLALAEFNKERSENTRTERKRGAYLVLQLHDELLYEVSSEDLPRVAEIVQQRMENALQLSVRFPVKMKAGTSWGKLEDYTPHPKL